MPSLLDLPREIRDIISVYALTNYSPLSIPNIFPHYHHGGSATIALSRSHLALTQTNRQLRAETRILFYAVNTFTICLQPVNVKYRRLKQDMQGKDEWQKIFRRSYGNLTMAEWFDELPDEAIGQLRGFKVYFACVLRWRGDEVAMEREKCRAYRVADIPGMATTRMTKHILYDKCSGPQLFYEIDLDAGSIESFVEVVRARREGEESEWGGTECNVCLGALQKWLGSVSVVDGKMRIDRAALERLVWPSNLEPTTEPKKVVDPPDSRI